MSKYITNNLIRTFVVRLRNLWLLYKEKKVEKLKSLSVLCISNMFIIIIITIFYFALWADDSLTVLSTNGRHFRNQYL